MKALVYTGPESMEIQDSPDPSPGPEEHLIRVDRVGICGSDMHAYLGHDARRPAPLILGHEAAGTIVGGPRDGMRVTVNPLVVDPACSYVQAGRENLSPTRQIISMPPREGAFAQYISMPWENLVEVPDHVPLTKAALAEPLAVSWHTVRLAIEALYPTMDRSAIILGGGAIGLAAALCLRAMGCEATVIVEPNDVRRDYLKSLGENVVAEAAGMYPLVIDAVGIGSTRKSASDVAAPGGVIAHVGLGDSKEGLDVRRLTLQEITFIGTYCYTKQEFRDTAQALFDGRLGPLEWTETRTLDDGAAAFADIRAGRTPAPKIILSPWD
ncbi:MAG: alcohol dehydrogenase catalytic domain-containing protein [Marinovum sp.]|nr:alcohol dehydrogenase catalytic domain-containing protein [Marinovum sp.]